MIMKKALLTTAAAILSLSLSFVVTAGNIEKAERYSVPLEQQQTVSEMDMSAVETGYVDAFVQTELELGDKLLGSNAEIQELGGLPPPGPSSWWWWWKRIHEWTLDQLVPIQLRIY